MARRGSTREQAFVRLRILLAAGVGAALVLGGLFFFTKANHPAENPEIPVEAPENVSQNSSNSLRKNSSSPALVAATPSPEPSLTAPANSLDDQIFELTELGARNDPESFRRIIASLQDPKPEIRTAALEATIQFGSRDAIPVLKELAAKTEDAREKVAILDAAEFLELPSFREVRDRRRAKTNSPVVAPK